MSPASAILSDSQARIFTWVFGQPGRSFHLNQLWRLTGLGSGSLQREVNRMTDAGLVTAERVGNQRRFQANPNSPIFAELVSLTRKTIGLAPLVQRALSPLTAKLELAWVVGPAASPTEVGYGDVDLLLVGSQLLPDEVQQHLQPLAEQLGCSFYPKCCAPAEFASARTDPASLVSRMLAQPALPLIAAVARPA